MEACEHHRIKRLCTKCNPRPPREPGPRKVKGRIRTKVKDEQSGEEAEFIFALTDEGLMVRRKHRRVKNTKLFKFDTLVALLDFTFTAKAQAKVPEVPQPDQAELFPTESEPKPQQVELTLQ